MKEKSPNRCNLFYFKSHFLPMQLDFIYKFTPIQKVKIK